MRQGWHMGAVGLSGVTLSRYGVTSSVRMYTWELKSGGGSAPAGMRPIAAKPDFTWGCYTQKTM